MFVATVGTASERLAAAEALEPRACLLVEPIAEPARRRLRVRDAGELIEKGAGRPVAHLLPARSTDCGITRDQQDRLPSSVLGCEPLEHGVGVGGVAHGQRPDPPLLTVTVEHDHAVRATDGHEAREQVRELLPVPERSGVEQV